MENPKITETGDPNDDQLMQDVVDAVMAVMVKRGLDVAEPGTIPVRNVAYPEKPDPTDKLELVVRFKPLENHAGPVLYMYHDFSFSSVGNLTIFLDCQ